MLEEDIVAEVSQTRACGLEVELCNLAFRVWSNNNVEQLLRSPSPT